MAGTRRPPPRRRPAPAAPPPASGIAPRARLVLTTIAALGIVGVGVALWLAGRPSRVDPQRAAEARSALAAAGCSLRLVAAPKDASAHSVAPDGSSAEWATAPPTAGPHDRDTAVYGAYDRPLQQARVVHNLEHGAVAIEYGPEVGAATVAMLRRFYDADARGLLLAPYPGLGARIALGAWIAEGGNGHGQGVLGTCSRYDERAFSAFVAAYRFHGPERIRASSMDPGER